MVVIYMYLYGNKPHVSDRVSIAYRYVLFACLELKLEMLIYITKTNAVVDLGSGMQQQQPETFV